MSPILLGVSCALTLLTLGSMAILYWMVLRPMRQTIQGTAELLRDLANSLSPAVVALGNQLDGVPQQLLPLLRSATRETYETGVFLPDDQQAANLERQMLASEDRMIRTTGGQPFSPLHSSSSDSRSRRGSSSRAARNSGNR